MEDRLDNLDPSNPPSEGLEHLKPEENKTFTEEGNPYIQSVEDFLKSETMKKDSAQPVQSRFKKWIKAVAVAVVLVFVPEQASWAFNYNPMVLWGDKDRDGAGGGGAYR